MSSEIILQTSKTGDETVTMKSMNDAVFRVCQRWLKTYIFVR